MLLRIFPKLVLLQADVVTLAQGEDEVKVLQLKSPECYEMSDLIVALPRCPENQELTFTSVKH